MHPLRIWFERWVLSKVVHHYWGFGIWIWHRLVIHYDIDRDRASDLIRSIDTVDFDLTLLLSDIRTGKTPCHTPGVTTLLTDYFRLSEIPDWETVDAIHTALDRERADR